MDKNKLIKAVELDQQITNCQEDIKKWERAVEFEDMNLNVKPAKGDAVRVSLKHVGFDAIKGIALSNLKGELSKLQSAFKKL